MGLNNFKKFREDYQKHYNKVFDIEIAFHIENSLSSLEDFTVEEFEYKINIQNFVINEKEIKSIINIYTKNETTTIIIEKIKTILPEISTYNIIDYSFKNNNYKDIIVDEIKLEKKKRIKDETEYNFGY